MIGPTWGMYLSLTNGSGDTRTGKVGTGLQFPKEEDKTTKAITEGLWAPLQLEVQLKVWLPASLPGS